jgi:hypothetical protein
MNIKRYQVQIQRALTYPFKYYRHHKLTPRAHQHNVKLKAYLDIVLLI